MVFNIDCARTILLTIEDFNTPCKISLDELAEAIPQFSQNELAYCCTKLYEGGLLNVTFVNMLGSGRQIKTVNDITYSGHSFLENIRNDENYSKVKTALRKIGSSSLSIVPQVAALIIEEKISAYFKR
ncbi:MAG: DUF2513 domain-containing protein [Eubacterium sp.]|nr:DUF2513 domain-containing protein [Eubacterium sp.]